MKGWFDAFRYDGGPTLYTFNNRTPVTGDVTVITFLLIFSTLYFAFLLIFPGIRKERVSTFSTVTITLFVGAVILVTRFGSGWHVGSTSIASTYRAFSKEKITADIGAYVGLEHVNITFRAAPTLGALAGGSSNDTNSSEFNNNWTGADVDFNERFRWLSASDMSHSYREALVRGLPFPVLTVAEYFSLGQEGFSWGSQYRSAGYYATVMLWVSFATWLLMNLLLVVVPRYGAVMMLACGGLLVSTDLGYLYMLPRSPLVVHLEGGTLHFHLGWCFWLVLIAGCICLLTGLIITGIETIFPHRFSTILEVDYDTPYDRHIIIEDSHGKRFQKKRASSTKLEEPAGLGLGSRILRRLSSKTREENGIKPLTERSGVDNQAFEMDPPKSPWRYPFRRAQAVGLVTPGGRHLARSASQDSTTSSIASSRARGPAEVAAIHKDVSRFRPTPADSKLRDVSMW